jgi:hypothetical protein
VTTPDLDASLQIILDSLPPDSGVPGQRHRQHALTRSDALLISNMIKVAVQNQGCSIGLTDDQMLAIRGIPAGTFRDVKDMVKERRKILNALGLMTLAVLGWLGKWIFEKIDWVHVWQIMTGKP